MQWAYTGKCEIIYDSSEDFVMNLTRSANKFVLSLLNHGFNTLKFFLKITQLFFKLYNLFVFFINAIVFIT